MGLFSYLGITKNTQEKWAEIKIWELMRTQ
jgi:hypothetical protein